MEKSDKIYVAGHNGLLGSAIIRLLKEKGYTNLITKSSKELDLCNQKETFEFIKNENPDFIILTAAKVGSIKENKENPAEFLTENIEIEMNVINSAFKNGVKNLIFISSSVVYPENAPQPLKEKYLLNGPLEFENEAYGLAKIIGIKACEYYNKEYGYNYISVLPTNLYGINDNFDSEHSHVIPGIIKRMHDAKIENKPYIEVWGTGNIYREFLFIDDAADAILFILENSKDMDNFINIGSDEEILIKDLVFMLKEIIGYEGEILFDKTKSDGVYRRKLNNDKLNLMGWNPKTPLKEGLKITFQWYLKNKKVFEN
ncbi:GDP-L-fucose synthase family protein [Methanobrevibacter sp. UBA417]|jgi:GDP-L-fucose synthase|uniref:GDP-L-fucose synthase family protein n=1 Tax=Methanobrevibacter sp. UBA417 TaxID=1915487 RepID=UPI0039B8C073